MTLIRKNCCDIYFFLWLSPTWSIYSLKSQNIFPSKFMLKSISKIIFGVHPLIKQRLASKDQFLLPL